jgi:Rrf2 family protein
MRGEEVMKVSTKGRYGLRALVDLAIYSSESHVSLVNIASRQQISLNYLEQVFAALRKAGIVKSLKGAQGGYTLAEKPNKIKVADIIKTLEGDFQIAGEVSSQNSEEDRVGQVIQNLVWNQINERIEDILMNTTLEDLVNEYQRISVPGQQMYYI